MFEHRDKQMAWRMVPTCLRNLEATATGTSGTARARADARAELKRAPLAEIAADGHLDPGDQDYVRELMDRVATGRYDPPASPLRDKAGKAKAEARRPPAIAKA